MLNDDERPSLVQLRKIGRDLRQNLHKERPPNTPFSRGKSFPLFKGGKYKLILKSHSWPIESKNAIKPFLILGSDFIILYSDFLGIFYLDMTPLLFSY